MDRQSQVDGLEWVKSTYLQKNLSNIKKQCWNYT